ncbi:hypothetical protein L917_02132 [Phytophthora nicotianae]|uniref:Uncharacterized protein n=1 Tax=Phytophthora nicotianae TaxID=4792 RepID=W2P3F0_PHYNI|nr:hypothetical protein L915_02236 [Phytophthora nicotianae]ETL48177.1 hypothetical protein L916_02194 [Phytophthora nicotianae]ETM01264.1 hypothetical protein L917_02132 [Phytophthora nicotianae]ETM54459.1 hypothetical protein L914_02218 [Phytophthora nicotianae]
MSEKYTSLSGNRDKTQSDSDSELEYGILIGFLPLLQDYFTSNYSGERLMIVLYILSGKSNRDALERSQHGPGTISTVLRQEIAIIKARYYEYVQQPTNKTPTRIRCSTKFFRILKSVSEP